MVEIEVESSYSGYSRYNTIIMCGGFDELSSQLYVVSAQKAEAESGVRVEASAAHHIEVIIYFVPKSTPQGKNEAVVDHPPFEAHISIKSGKRALHNKVHQINAWGGAAIKLNLEL